VKHTGQQGIIAATTSRTHPDASLCLRCAGRSGRPLSGARLVAWHNQHTCLQNMLPTWQQGTLQQQSIAMLRRVHLKQKVFRKYSWRIAVELALDAWRQEVGGWWKGSLRRPASRTDKP
jgi:hypothetical protein